MVGTKLYNPKHNAVGVVADEPQTASGYWTIHYPDLDIYRRYDTMKVRDLANLFSMLESAKFVDIVTGKKIYAKKSQQSAVVLDMSQATPQRQASAVSTQDGWLYFSVIQGGRR